MAKNIIITFVIGYADTNSGMQQKILVSICEIEQCIDLVRAEDQPFSF